ncbi:MAG: NUDIX hydrolase [Rhodobacteraceae bacterium]|nr:NUDIX hydrolase [Paracoccaceae bacterium]
MIPRLGENVRKGIQYRLRPGAYVILPRAGRVLLTFQEAPRPEFQLPGGGIDPGENVLPALYREVLEETGWTIARPRRFAVYRRFTYMPEYDRWAEKLCTVYVAHPVRRVSDPVEEGHTAVWLPAAAAVSAVASTGDRDALEQYLNG